MTAPSLVSRAAAVVKAALVDLFSDAVDNLLSAATSGVLTPRSAEVQTGKALVSIGAAVLTALLATLARRATEAALERSHQSAVDVKMRFDREYCFTTPTTFGPVVVPWFAFVHGRRVEVPAREVFPLQASCRSSELCLEWETTLAADHPFRQAATALSLFTHGAVDLEDTPRERHAVLVGQHVEPDWLYRTPSQIRSLLAHAKRDEATGRPVVYVSTDAHALRFLRGETWRIDWKMVNGIRVWCVDDRTAALVHLGGEYVRGDCRDVAARFAALPYTSGHLSRGGDHGDGIVAEIVLVTDGVDWIRRHVVLLFDDPVHVLDPYHVVEQVADAATKLFPRAPGKGKQIVRAARRALGIRDRRERTHVRKGLRKRRHKNRHVPFRGAGNDLVTGLERVEPVGKSARKRLDSLLDSVRSNLFRLDYGDLRNRGVSIGSGAMESLHRFGSQLRRNLSGSRWTPDVAHAMLQVRMLAIPDR